jgi:hypothetical protein
LYCPKSTIDGPFAETKEQLGGFYLVEAPVKAAAMAAKIPGARLGCEFKGSAHFPTAVSMNAGSKPVLM